MQTNRNRTEGTRGKTRTNRMEKIKNHQKNNRPTETELRPIAMTDVSYKILMSLIGRETRSRKQNRKNEEAGFTKGGKILDNLFILRECVEETYWKKNR